MDLFEIEEITDKNIDTLIEENFWKGVARPNYGKFWVWCQGPYMHITFDFIKETLTIREVDWYSRKIPIKSFAPKRMMRKIEEILQTSLAA